MIPPAGPSMLKRFLAGMVAIFVLTATGSATALLLEFDRINDIANGPGTAPPVAVPELDIDPGGPQTLLLIGSDRRLADRQAGRKSRSDTMILVRLDPGAGATTVLSLPRDLRTRFASGRVDKLNYAYEAGGARGVVRAVKRLMGDDFPVNHVANVSFGAFTRGVKFLDCFHIDVDRRYFNDNDPPNDPQGQPYAAIDLQPGYQRMCGLDSLDFVRFRHLDTDFVRSARQQHYLALAKDQVDFGRLLRDRDELVKIFATYTETDVRSLTARLRLLKLASEAARQPLRRVELEGEISEDLAYVDVSDDELARARREFLDPPAVREDAAPAPRRRAGGARPRRRTGAAALAPSLERAPRIEADGDAGFPVAVPTRIVDGSRPWDGHSKPDPRAYTITDRDGGRHRAHRVTIDAGPPGRFYGVQSTTWRDPPIVSSPSSTQVRGGRRLMLFREGRRLRLVAWREGGALHWVANTLERTLTNREMLGIAQTARVRR